MANGTRRHRAATGSWGDLFERIGAFLDAHRLSPDPAHYTFAYAVLSAAEGATGTRKSPR